MKFRTEQDLEDRAVILGEYIIEHKATVRAAAKHFGISKSTVHMAVPKRKIQFLLFCKSKPPVERVVSLSKNPIFRKGYGVKSYNERKMWIRNTEM